MLEAAFEGIFHKIAQLRSQTNERKNNAHNAILSPYFSCERHVDATAKNHLYRLIIISGMDAMPRREKNAIAMKQ